MISSWKHELVSVAGELLARGNKAPGSSTMAQKVIDDLHPEDRSAAGRARFSSAGQPPSSEC